MAHWKSVLAVTIFGILIIGSTLTRTADQTLVAAGSTWKYNDSGTNLGTGWRATAYNDTAWKSGAAQLGYGDSDETTVISYGTSATNRYITYYFRRSFTVANPAAFSGLSVRFIRDDGAVIYVNGVEVVRSNMPTGTITSATLATAAIGSTDEATWLQASIDPALLVAGTNVIAVEIHQQSRSSSDVSFDLELRASEAAAAVPTVTLMSPATGTVTNTAAVTFTAAVTAPAGLASATLYLGGPPQTVVFSGPAQVLDTHVSADAPTIANGSATSVNVDGLSPHAHGLVKFPTLIGSGTGAVPAGAVITAATLQLNCTNSGNVMRLYRLTQDWVEDQATWTSRATGMSWGAPGADGAASNAGVALNGDCTATGVRSIDVTRFVQEWSNGASNYGMVLTDSGTDGVAFSSSESASSPALTVVYRSTQQPVATQSLSGTSATVSFTGTLPGAQAYSWNVQTVDTAGRQTWAPADFQIALDAASPDEPVLVSPSNGAANVPVSTTLQARVSDPGGSALTTTVELRKAAAPEFTVIVLPDTQHYSESTPAIFTSQTQWIVDQKDARNIVFVTHEGDIVEHYNNTTEWQRANTSMSLLDGVVPYGMGPGNHDQPTSFFNTYFPYTRYQNQYPWYGGHYQNLNDNNYQLFSGGGMDFVIVHLEFCPSTGAVAWADSIYKTYPNRIGIMTTHGYLNESAQRTVGGCSSTQYLWDGLAVPNPNLHFMLSGHVHDESSRTDTANGHPVFQLMADFQDRAPTGGEGWLRILRFVPSDGKVYVQTYSPWLNQFETDANSQFTLDFPMGAEFTSLGSTTAASGSTVSVSPVALVAGTTYEWRVTVTNTAGKSRTSPVWNFTTGTGGPVNQPPVANAQSVDLSEDGSTPVTLSASDFEGSLLTYAVVGGPAHGTLTGTPPALTYSPAANYSGTDSFTFRANDGAANSNVATVSVSVQPVNDPPAATGESYVVQSGATLTVNAPGVLSNDTDIDGPPLSAQLVTVPAHGALALSANGGFTFTPATGYTGLDAFTYRASDGAAQSAQVTVSITVQAVPTGPPPTVTFGLTTLGSIADTGDSNYLNGSLITTTSGGAAVSMSAYVGALDSSTTNRRYQLAIYTNVNGRPGSLVAVSASGTLVANAWNTLALQATLQANTSYWLMYNTNGRSASVNNMRFNTVANGQGTYSTGAVAFGTWPASFPASTLSTSRFSLYVTVQP